MRKVLVVAGALAALVAAPLMLGGTANAAVPAAPAAVGLAAQMLDITDDVAFVYRGRRHCWYGAGWNGPGWYWCGYGARRGLGWGGPAGFRGWVYRGPGVIVRPRPRHRGPAIIIRP